MRWSIGYVSKHRSDRSPNRYTPNRQDDPRVDSTGMSGWFSER